MPTIKSTRLGTGFPVIFLHGFCETKDMWFPFVEPLAKQYEVICPDLPGYGASLLSSKSLSLDNVADELAEHLAELGITSAAVIGHSLGGYVALSLAERHPELINGLGLFHSTAYPDSEEAKHRRDKALLFLKKHPVAKFIEPFIPSLFSESRKTELADEIAKATKIGLQTPLDTITAYTLAMRERKDLFGLWCSLPYPCLFIGGVEDSRIPVEACEAHIEARDRIDGHILRNTAHMGMYESPSECLDIVQDFLLKLDY